MDSHVCPFGAKSRWLLKSKGYLVEDHHLTSREETDAFKALHGVSTTPQTFVDGRRIGGYEALVAHFGGRLRGNDEASYSPVIAVFAVALGLAFAVSTWALGTPFTIRAAEWFVAFALAMLAMLKLQDVERFSTMFLNYDLLARRFVPYAYLYPFLEASVAILMAGRMLPWISIPLALVIGSVGAVSVIYAIYVQKRELRCACVGGGANVPLGAVSLTENLAMVGMGLWMLVRTLAG